MQGDTISFQWESATSVASYLPLPFIPGFYKNSFVLSISKINQFRLKLRKTLDGTNGSLDGTNVHDQWQTP